MIMSNCDMHTHTTCSDGKLTPVEIVKLAHSKNVEYFSVTDHDSVDFYEDTKALKLLDEYNIKYIPGCEFVCQVDNNPIEILGYGIDVKKAKKYLEKHGVPHKVINEIRIKQAPKVFKKLGLKLDLDKNKYDLTDALMVIYQQSIKDEKIKNMMLEENEHMLDDKSKLLRLGLNNANSKFFINASKFYPSYKKIIKVIQKKLHGIASLAHPYQYGDVMDYVLNKVKDAKIDSIEAYHFTTVLKERQTYLINFAQKNNLLVSGGSDFHIMEHIQGENARDKIYIPDTVYKNIRKKLDEKQK